MYKKFGGFTDTQLEAIARKMGHEGSMDAFNEWVAGDKERATKLSRYSEKARMFVEDPEGYAKGGAVTKSKEARLRNERRQAQANQPTDTPATTVTEKAIKDPSKVATLADPVKTDVNKNQTIPANSGQVGPAAKAKAAAAKAAQAKAATAGNAKTGGDAAKAAQPDATKANTYEATQVGDEVEGVLDDTEAVQGTVSEQAKVTAAQALPSANATVQGQMSKLMKQFEGGETPPWAAGAMRMAQTAMSGRGLGASSMAGAAITQAAMESAIGIAASDAATFSQFEMANLNNRQQARLQNAQSFLQMDLANLDVANQTNLFKAQARIQSMFTDQAADNAAKQFNASSENQTDQFFAGLKSQVAQFNAAQQNAMKQFNASQTNTMKQFNTAQTNTVSMFNAGETNQMRIANAQQAAALSMFNAEQINARDQFNANNRLIIDQANAKWRQQIATQDNAQINETNRLNAQLATGLTTQAYNNLFQQERDLMAFAFTAAENANQRSHEIVLQKMTNKSYKDLQKSQSQAAMGEAAGKLISNIVDGLFS